eukprot:6151821-Pyramimonas_sp.AAC.1
MADSKRPRLSQSKESPTAASAMAGDQGDLVAAELQLEDELERLIDERGTDTQQHDSQQEYTQVVDSADEAESTNKDEEYVAALNSFSVVLHGYNIRIPTSEYSQSLKDDINNLIVKAKMLQSFYESHPPEAAPPTSVAVLHAEWLGMKGLAKRLTDPP